MRQVNVGCLLVVDDAGKLVGIISERDLVTRVIAAGADPESVSVGDVMTETVTCCQAGASIQQVQEIMSGQHVRHVPIVEDGVPVGVLSIREVTSAMHDRDRQMRDLTIFAMAKLAESRDPDTGGHLERVQAYTAALASALVEAGAFPGLIDEEFLALLPAASPLHDIGKVGIPDHVLLKPGRLDPPEYEIMKTHSAKGSDTLESVLRLFPDATFIRMGRDIARHHHERTDGTGYPDSLAGDDIPLAARIFAVADVYDALVAKRVYKEAYSAGVASDIILGGKGTQFDPAVVEAFVTCQSHLEQIREKHDQAGVAA